MVSETNFVGFSWEEDLASSLLLKNINALFWFLFLLFGEAVEEITALDRKLG